MAQDDDVEGFLRRYRQMALNRLERHGSIETECGSIDFAGDSVSFASDPGCETFNDDFICFWRPKQAGKIHWAAAVADGVTGSMLAEEAAELACYFGLCAVAKLNTELSASSQNPLAFATRLFHQMGRKFLLQPERLVPSGCPKSIWRVATREGKFLQTTLNLIWSTDEGLRFVAVGDGGLLYSMNDAPGDFATHQLGSGKLQCIGPRSVSVALEAYLLPDWNCFACYTDGMAEPVQQLGQLPAILCDRDRTVATVIDHLNNDHPELVNDNLSAFRVVRLLK